MKKHAKKVLKHDVEVLGKTVPTLAIAALFLIGGGTAATLTVFGTTSGTATIDQAITVNGNSAEDESITSNYDLASTAGESSVYTANITNNLDAEQTVGISTNTVTPTVDSDVAEENTDSGDSVETAYYTVDLLFSENNSEGIDSGTSGVDEVVEEGSMTSEIVYYEPQGRAAIRARGQTIYAEDDQENPVANTLSSSFAGAQFDVVGDEPFTYTGDRELVVDYAVGPDHSNQDGTFPDWVTYNVTYNDENYYVSTFTADTGSGNTFTMSENLQTITDSDGNVVYGLGVDEEDEEVTPEELEGSATVQDVSVATGSGADDETFVDMYYYGVSFDGNELFDGSSSDSFDSLTLEPGSTQLAVENSLDLAAVPGSYTVTTDVEPNTE
jgi:hypothetical protein